MNLTCKNSQKHIVPVLLLAIALTMPKLSANAEPWRLTEDSVPFVGAQVFIEPGQSASDVDSFFRTMAESRMKVCRIRMFESYMRTSDGWDFSLFDNAFEAAGKYGIGVWCTLFPEGDKLDLGGWKFPYDETVRDKFMEFIKAVVLHYRENPALRGWVLINEPGGIAGSPESGTPFLNSRRSAWEAEQPEKEFTDHGYPMLLKPRNLEFLNNATTEFLGEIAAEIAKYDTGHDIHVNPHSIFSNYGEYDFPAWRDFLTSLGGSAHPAWHFGYFKREDYALAMLAQSEMLRSGAGNLPWFMTEIQGGNNIYSGGNALCPTPEEITQWLWTVIGCEGKGGIFWTLNPRATGTESGEWALTDFQGRPSERMKAAAEVAETIDRHPDIFRNAKEDPSGIDILYIKEAQWAESLLGKDPAKNERYEGRRHGAVMKSALACFRALSERGLNVGLKEISEYDFSGKDHKGKTVIIPNQISVPTACASDLENFVRNGGTLVIEGLTGYYDENLQCNHVAGFPFAKAFGGKISEYLTEGEVFEVATGLPAHLWHGKIAGHKEDILTTRIGRGKTVWIPSNIALGAWVSDDYSPLSDFLAGTAMANGDSGFGEYHRGMLLRTLHTDKGWLLVCIGNSDRPQTVSLRQSLPPETSVILHASDGCRLKGRRLTMEPQSVCVIFIPEDNKREQKKTIRP